MKATLQSSLSNRHVDGCTIDEDTEVYRSAEGTTRLGTEVIEIYNGDDDHNDATSLTTSGGRP